MYKRGSWCCLLLCTFIVISVACKNKPAYSDIDANRTARSQNQNQNQSGEAQPNATQPNAAESPGAPATQPAPAAPRTPPIKQPSFIDPVRNEIKDLPNYPRAVRVSLQMGPTQGVNVMSEVLLSPDTIEKITAFYENVIKTNKWTIVDKTINSEVSSWTLTKGETDSARVQITKKPDSRMMNIVIVRGEKMQEPAK